MTKVLMIKIVLSAGNLQMYLYAPFGSPLQRMENRDLFTEVYTRLEATARDIFSHMGGRIISG
jgi:hypothetical protein